MGRFENIRVFEDTVRRCAAGKLRAAIEASTARQELILGDGPQRSAAPTSDSECASLVGGALRCAPRRGDVLVSRRRTMEAAARYRGKRVAVLNFASASNPGGGVTSGSSAQEEAICRVSTLYFSLNVRAMWDGFYGPHRQAHDPLHNDDIIYTPDVVVFKSDTDRPEPLPESDWFTVDVITCAAPNLREKPSNAMNAGDGDRSVVISPEALEALHVKRFTRILEVAAARGAEVVILGAFGCGAFRNDPVVVARAAKRALEPFRTRFETIEFAVYCSPRGGDENYRAFHTALA